MDSLGYNPDLEDLKQHFDLSADYLNFRFLIPQSWQGQEPLDQALLLKIQSFCTEWSLDTAHSSNWYFIAIRTLPSGVLDAFKKIAEERPKVTGHNFRSEAYYGLASGYESYFKAHGIEQGNQMRRYEIIGRLMMLSGLALRENQELPEGDTSRRDVDVSNPDLTGKRISDIVRNWTFRAARYSNSNREQ